MKKAFLLFIFLYTQASCQTTYPNQNPTGSIFPKIIGQSLKGDNFKLPDSFAGEYAVLLVGYDQGAQFDIDRWLLAFTDHQLKTPIFEIPAIDGIAKLFASKINQGMREGIPSGLWSQVITIYEDSPVLLKITGNKHPKNTRVIVLNPQGKITYFYDQGYAVGALKKLLKQLPPQDFQSCRS
ncbi:MAG: hypothetical protein AB8C84_01300 [Oligoflexales bacterium]